MQTKKRVSGRNASREYATTGISRSQKKLVENGQVVEQKAPDLITSSVRKHRCGAKRTCDSVPTTNLNAKYDLEHDDRDKASSWCDAADHGDSNQEAAECMRETIFSPAFHVSKIAGDEIANGGSKLFQNGDHGSGTDCSQVHMLDGNVTRETFESTFREVDGNLLSKNLDVQNCGDQMLSVDTSTLNCDNMDIEGAGLSSEVSAIYLAMKNSKLECVDERGQDSMSDVCMDDDGYEEYDDFDPYLFIKNLPELSSVVPTFRPMLLPKQTRSCPPTTLVLDLDETLVHSTLEPCEDADFTFPVNFNLQEHTVYVRCRPYLKDFMDRVSRHFEIIIFTASQSIYAEQLLNVLDPKRKVFRHRVFRESCVFVEGNYLKDLSVLGRDLARVIIVDNSPQAFGFQVDNGIPIESWFDDRSDQELLLLLPFLESLVGVEDVRPLIAKKYNLREKIATAVYPSFKF